MAPTLKHLRSSTANKRPTASGLADGQLALNTASGTPALFFKDNGGTVVKIGPAHVGSAAPNVSPAGSAGNSLGELWVDNGTTINGLKYYDGSDFVNLTPSGTTTAAGLVELATNAETQTGTDAVRAVTPSGLQSKISDSTSTTSSTTIASATAVKAAYDLANAALPKSGGSITGELLIAPSGSLVFEGSTDDGFETTLAVTNPTADRTITLPNTTGTVVTTGDNGTVTSAMIANGTIVNADINASAAIADTKLDTISTAGKVSNSATTATAANTASAIVARNADGNFAANVISASLLGNVTGDLTGTASAIADNTVTSAKIVDGAIVNADVNASAAIAGTKISPDFGSQNIVTTGTSTASGFIPTGSGVPTNGMYLPAANELAFATNSTERVRIDSSGRLAGDVHLLGSLVLGTANSWTFATNWEGLKVTDRHAVQATPGASSIAVSSNAAIGASGWEYTVSGVTAGLYSNAGGIHTFSSAASGTDGDPVTWNEYVRIDSAGDLLVGYTVDNGAYKLQVNSQIFATSATIATSDGRYKENVANLDGCLSLVKALRPVSFTWKPQEDIMSTDDDGNETLVREGHNFPGGVQVGFIAQEVQEALVDQPWLGSVIKENVRPAINDDAGNELAPEEQFLGIAEGNLIAVLTQALQEAIAKIETLEAKVATIEAQSVPFFD